MAKLTPEFQHDVFVSYPHGDVDQVGSSPLKTWSLAFASELEAELRTTPGLQHAAVFIDESRRPEHGLDAVDPLTEQLRKAATGAAFLLILMSPHYLESIWCTEERSWWLTQAALKSFPEIGSRIFVARVWPTSDEAWPKELCDEAEHPPLGIWFHERPGNQLTTRPFGWPRPTDAAGDFRDALVDLAGKIAVRLTKLNETLAAKREVAANIAKLSAEGGQAIYVHAREQDKAHWENACRDLITAGYGVFPHAPEADSRDPQRSLRADGEIVRTLSACDALLLVPSEDPWSLMSDLAVVGHQRRNSARALTRRPLPCAVVDRGLLVDDKSRLQRSAKNLHIDWINAATENWTTQVKGWLTASAGSQIAAP